MAEPTREWTFWWGMIDNLVVVTDEGQLEALLDRASADAAASFTMAELRSPAGAACAVGLGRQVSVATFCASSTQPPYYVSTGRLELDEPIVFYYDGHWTEFEPRAAIPLADARKAMTAFFETERLPTSVAWAEV